MLVKSLLFCYFSGADYNFNDPIILVFRPEDDRLPIPVTLLQDGIAEDKEQFQLFLALNEPIRGQSTGLSTTNIVIEDDDSKFYVHTHT